MNKKFSFLFSSIMIKSFLKVFSLNIFNFVSHDCMVIYIYMVMMSENFSSNKWIGKLIIERKMKNGYIDNLV